MHNSRDVDAVSPWRGEFVSAGLEEQFQRYVQARTAQQMRNSLFVAAGLFLLFSLSDYALLGYGDRFLALLGVRLVVVFAALTLAFALVRRPALVNSALAVNLVVFVGVTAVILIVPLRPQTVGTQVPAVMVATIAVYLFFPNRIPWMVLLNLYLAIGFIAAVVAYAPIPAGTILTMTLLLVFVNTVGLMTAARLSRLRREQYASLLEEREINQRLQEEIAERQRLEEQLKHMARTDELTGLNTRRRFFELVEQELRRARRERTPLAVCMVDVDHFKTINDRHGHTVGDRALRALARRCREVLREADIIGRFGGEEFTIALPGTGVSQAREVAERLRAHVAAMEIPASPSPLRPTVTIGLAQVEPGERSVEPALNRADEALYHGKGAGRDCVIEAPASTLDGDEGRSPEQQAGPADVS